MSDLTVGTDLANINVERTHDSNWLLKTDLDTCDDKNGVTIPDPAGLANTDLMSTGRGKFNLDKPIFAKIGTNKWALLDMRAQFLANTIGDPAMDG